MSTSDKGAPNMWLYQLHSVGGEDMDVVHKTVTVYAPDRCVFFVSATFSGWRRHGCRSQDCQRVCTWPLRFLCIGYIEWVEKTWMSFTSIPVRLVRWKCTWPRIIGRCPASPRWWSRPSSPVLVLGRCDVLVCQLLCMYHFSYNEKGGSDKSGLFQTDWAPVWCSVSSVHAVIHGVLDTLTQTCRRPHPHYEKFP